MSETVNIIEFKASGRRGRCLSMLNPEFYTFKQFFGELRVAQTFIDARFVLEPEPVKLPEDRWAVVDRNGMVCEIYLTRDIAEERVDDACHERGRVVRVRFEEVSDAR